jgi:hypothetical protein
MGSLFIDSGHLGHFWSYYGVVLSSAGPLPGLGFRGMHAPITLASVPMAHVDSP